MQNKLTTFFALAGLLIASSLHAAAPSDTALKEKAQAREDFVRLNDDGNIAYKYISSARSAIFEGALDDAKTFLKACEEQLQRARADRTTFTNDERALGAPTTTPTSNGAKEQTIWLPIHGEIKLYGQPQNAAASESIVIAANRYLHSGHLGHAGEILHQHNVGANYVISAIPLQESQSKIGKAETLLEHTPYQANQMLKSVQDSVSYETVPLTVASPKGTGQP